METAALTLGSLLVLALTIIAVIVLNRSDDRRYYISIVKYLTGPDVTHDDFEHIRELVDIVSIQQMHQFVTQLNKRDTKIEVEVRVKD